MKDLTFPLPDVTRAEIADHRAAAPVRGNALTALGVDVTVSLQDDGRTLKVFLKDRADEHTPERVAAAMATGLAQSLTPDLLQAANRRGLSRQGQR